MGPLELHEHMQRERERIDGELEASSKSGQDYAFAYGQCKSLLLFASLEIAKCDPSFNLEPIVIDPQSELRRTWTYETVVDREA